MQIRETLKQLPERIQLTEETAFKTAQFLDLAKEELKAMELDFWKIVLAELSPDGKPKHSNEKTREIAVRDLKLADTSYQTQLAKVRSLEEKSGLDQIATKLAWGTLRVCESISRLRGDE